MLADGFMMLENERIRIVLLGLLGIRLILIGDRLVVIRLKILHQRNEHFIWRLLSWIYRLSEMYLKGLLNVKILSCLEVYRTGKTKNL